ncbi:YraN family protein [Paenibacillus sp. D2_2]|uniref:YraN family protein n=1 Tax=Paenibacillus sp. D2_2 TaxID=3073092 RepID=UPI00281502E3|nr:YraN family protein [Paenibacillus sp. D2_2]WMT39200.1 YraN family protein [Paenibacillus sp. D2_2]
MRNTNKERSITDERQVRGRRAESMAAQYLQDQGYKILAKNWRCRTGELDLIVTKRSRLSS